MTSRPKADRREHRTNEDRHQNPIGFVRGSASATAQPKARLRTVERRRGRSANRAALRVLCDAYRGNLSRQSETPVFYTTIRTPLGRVLVAATSAGLARISFRRSETATLAELERRLEAQVVESAAPLAAILSQLEEYFAGARRSFDLPLDLSLATPFQRRVLEAARQVPPGCVVSYGDIAKQIGSPRAPRAVGQALGHNPIPIVIPCHRIIASDGTLGGYTGGLAIKRKLLALERRAAFGKTPATAGTSGQLLQG